MDAGEEPLADEGLNRRLRRVAKAIHIRAVVYAALASAAVYALPYFRPMAAPSHTAAYPSVTLATTFTSPSQAPPSRTVP